MIIAHVDRGKTTLVDCLLRQSGQFRDAELKGERILDSNDLERERGITILSKNIAIPYRGVKINLIDTPGHADFGGEVERVVKMADGCLLLVDAAEGPMPQTKFVLSKALAQGLRPIVVINKVDRSDSRSKEVINEIFDLFVALDANDHQLDFPVLYASGRDGWCNYELDQKRENLYPLLDLILNHVKEPEVDLSKPFAMLSTLLHSDTFLGRCLIGRVVHGIAKVNDTVKSLDLNNNKVEEGRLTKLFTFSGTTKVATDTVMAGDIVCVAGLKTTSVSDTICHLEVNDALKSTPIDPPTMSVTITVNDSPISGLEGKKVTSTMIRERLLAEAETNVAISFKENDQKDSFEIGGRGELQIGVLIETMRREGFELSVSRPKVLFKQESNKKLEPFEEVTIDVDEEYSSTVIDSINQRKGEMTDMRDTGQNKKRIIFKAPTRGLIGYQSKFLTETRGTGVMNRVFDSYGDFKGDIKGRRNGALISTDSGEAVAYAIFNLQDRGLMFIEPQTKVYGGMIVGEHNRDNDLEINVLKGKKLTNVRAAGSDGLTSLTPPVKMSLEEMMAYVNEDELLEVTPKNLRLRKKLLLAHERKKYSRETLPA